MVGDTKVIGLKEVVAETPTVEVPVQTKPSFKRVIITLMVVLPFLILSCGLSYYIGSEFVFSSYRTANCTSQYQGLVTRLTYDKEWIMTIQIYSGHRHYDGDEYLFKFNNDTYNEINPVQGGLIPLWVECNAFNDHWTNVYTLFPNYMKNTWFTRTIMIIVIFLSWYPILWVAFCFMFKPKT